MVMGAAATGTPMNALLLMSITSGFGFFETWGFFT